MRLHVLIFVATATAGSIGTFASPGEAADWITAPSTFTHDPTTAERVAQYSPIGPFYYYQRPDYMKSGYRHLRSTIDLGNSSDSLHIVEEWGRPVRPYDEWRFPYRPFSVPYDAWGPPFGGLGGGNGMFPYSGGGFGGGGFGPWWPGGGGPGGNFGNQPAVNFAQPWLDGHWPQYDFNDRSQYWRPYVAPVPGP
jgi:hypothetical protein